MNLSLQTQKADSFRFAPPSRKTTVLKAFLGYVGSSEVIENTLRPKRQNAQIGGIEVHAGYTEPLRNSLCYSANGKFFFGQRCWPDAPCSFRSVNHGVLSGPIQASDIFSGPANPRFAMQKESGSDVYSGFSNWRQCSQAIRTDSATRSRLNLQSGVPLDRVSILLGHSSIRITERHYSPRVRSRQEQLGPPYARLEQRSGD